MLTLARATTVAELYSSAHYGSISGLVAFWITLPRASGPSAVALVYTAAGQRYEPVLVWMAAVMMVAAAGYWSGESSAQPQRAGTVTRGMLLGAGIDCPR